MLNLVPKQCVNLPNTVSHCCDPNCESAIATCSLNVLNHTMSHTESCEYCIIGVKYIMIITQVLEMLHNICAEQY